MGLETLTEAKAPSHFKTLLTLAWPLILSNSIATVQITTDRLFLSQVSTESATASVAAMMIYWLPFILLFTTAGYVSTFVAQYTGAGRPHRVGPAVWQGIYFSILAGIAMLLLLPYSDSIFYQIDHSEVLQGLESQYFRCLCWYSLPALLTSVATGFFSGRGESIFVIAISLTGALVNAILDWIFIFGLLGLPEMGIWGAGLATVIGAWCSVLVGFALMLRRKYREENHILSGWRFDTELFRRLLRFGMPSGFQWALDVTAFNAFVILTGWFGDGDLAATGLIITINNLAFLPMLGIGQAASILVGRYLGENRPDIAEQVTWRAVLVAGGYMVAISLLYILLPSLFIDRFQGNTEAEKWLPIAEKVRILLWFVAAYSVFDAGNIVFSFALRGAGDTVFVSLVSLFLAWPVMVIPTYFAWKLGWGLYWAWGFASLYVALGAICYLIRFYLGKWKSMRVIESSLIEPELVKVGA
jgi:MATE family multidrug resistance protein